MRWEVGRASPCREGVSTVMNVTSAPARPFGTLCLHGFERCLNVHRLLSLQATGGHSAHEGPSAAPCGISLGLN